MVWHKIRRKSNLRVDAYSQFLKMLLVCLLAGTGIRATTAAELPPRLRRPVALAFTQNHQRLLVANSRGKSFSLIDIAQQKTIAEEPSGGVLSDLQPLEDGNWMLATDESNHQLLLLNIQDDQVQIRQRVSVSPYPVSVVVDRKQQFCYVTSLWSKRVTRIRLNKTADAWQATVMQAIDMPFSPRELLLLPGESRLVVADSFGGNLALLDTSKPATGRLRLLGVRQFPGHNVRGLGLSANGEMLLVAHQMLNELAHTVRNDVHWGLLMSNDLRWLKIESLLKGGSDLYAGAHMHPLGEAGSATADPSGLAVSRQGVVVVTLGGVREVAIGRENDFSLQRVNVGRRPVAAVIHPDGERAYVANMFDDSVSVVDLDDPGELVRISLGPKVALTQRDRGELLFFDATLSHDSWMSCHSCHTDVHTNGLLNDNFSDASFGAPKRVFSLLGRSDTGPFAWNASARDLASQVRNSIEQTMQADDPAREDHVQQLVSFLKTLKTPPPIDKVRGTYDAVAVERGRAIFEKRQCVKCHAPPIYTTPKIYNVGLKDELDHERFNPPTLRGVGYRSSFFHDSRAKQLSDVFSVHGHQLTEPLEEKDLQDLMHFLRSL